MSEFGPSIERFVLPFAQTEGAVTALLAVALHEPQVRLALYALLLDRAAAPGTTEDARAETTATVEAMRRAEAGSSGVEVVTEAWLAHSGNLDLALVARETNAVIAIEHKTSSRLRVRQITKYRLALRDSDPHRFVEGRPRRVLCSVLLRPDPLTDCNKDIDWLKDPAGVEASTTITHADIQSILPEALVHARTHFLRAAAAHLDSLASDSTVQTAVADERAAMLDAVALAVDALPGVAAGRQGLAVWVDGPMPAPWWIRLGVGQRVLLGIRFATDRQAAAQLWERADPSLSRKPSQLIHLGHGWHSVGVPTPFPSHERVWRLSEPSEQRIAEQARVAANLVRDLLQAFRLS